MLTELDNKPTDMTSVPMATSSRKTTLLRGVQREKNYLGNNSLSSWYSAPPVYGDEKTTETFTHCRITM